MSDTYSAYGRSERPRRSAAMWLVDLLLTLCSIAAAATLAVTYFVPYVHPARVWFFPVLGLAAPVTYVVTLLLALYWVIRWRWVRAGLLLALLFVGFFRISLFYRPDIRRVYDAEYDRSSFKVMTYNVRGFYGNEGQSSVGEVVELIERIDPDIVCLQEFNARLAGRDERFARLGESYETVAFGRTEAPDSIHGAPMLLLSKYRILRSGTALTLSSSVWADLLVAGDTVRVFSNHLHSTAINTADDKFITDRLFLTDTAREEKVRSIVRRLRENSVLRAAQVDSIARVIGDTHTRRIVCGDFNDTPVSYVYRTMARGLEDAFSRCGSGYSHTFKGFFNILRIDYVLCSEGLEPLSYEVPDAECSDHLPVVVRLRKTTEKD